MKKVIAGLMIWLCAGALSSAFAYEDIVNVEMNKGKMIRFERPASSVVVANPAIADIQVISPQMVYVQGKTVGETSIYAMDEHHIEVMDATIEVTHNLSKLNRAVKAMLPNADINFKSTDNGLIIGGYADTPIEVSGIENLAKSFLGDGQAVINLVDTAGSDQVTLMVKVAEVSRSELKRFGINLASAITPGNFLFSMASGRSFVDAAGAVVRNGSDNSLFGNYNTNSTSISGIIDALETNGLVSVLAEPNLTTTSGKAASFLAGGEFPIPTVGAEGDVTIDYKPFGISLDFTPRVLSHDKISLDVAPEVSNFISLDSVPVTGNLQIITPRFETRRASTTVELGSGQTFAIAGLLQNDRSNNVSKFPGLGDLPILGSLFRSTQFQNDQSELVILVTPYIVRPMDKREKAKTPLEGYTPPDDFERLLLGKMYSEQHEADATKVVEISEAPTLHGEVGFILE